MEKIVEILALRQALKKLYLQLGNLPADLVEGRPLLQKAYLDAEKLLDALDEDPSHD